MSSEPPQHDFPPEASVVNPRTGQRESPHAEALRKAIYEQKHPPKLGTVRRKDTNGSGGKPSFPLTWVDEATLDLDRKALVKNLLDLGGFALIYGPSASGKSFFTADLAQQIATAQPWRGRKVTSGLVVYIAAEAGRSILQRFIAWRDNRMGELAQIPLAIITKGPSVLLKQDQVALAEQLQELQIQCAMPLVLVVFDTLSRSIPGGDENESRDMTEVIGFADYLRETFGTACAFVHHSGKDPLRGARGHSALFAAADLVLLVDNHQATVEKSRDGVAGEKFSFTLEPVDLGVDADGDPIGTCLLNHTDQPAPSGPRIVKLSGVAKVGLQALVETTQQYGRTIGTGTSTIPNNARIVTLDQWRGQFKIRYGEEGGKSADSSRKSFQRAKEQLLSYDAISISDPYVWLITKAGQEA